MVPVKVTCKAFVDRLYQDKNVRILYSDLVSMLFSIFFFFQKEVLSPIPLTLFQTTNFRLQNWKRLQTIISDLMKMVESSRKHCGKSRNCCNFSFSHSVFKWLVLQTRKNQGLFGKVEISVATQMALNIRVFFPELVDNTGKYFYHITTLVSHLI